MPPRSGWTAACACRRNRPRVGRGGSEIRRRRRSRLPARLRARNMRWHQLWPGGAQAPRVVPGGFADRAAADCQRRGRGAGAGPRAAGRKPLMKAISATLWRVGDAAPAGQVVKARPRGAVGRHVLGHLRGGLSRPGRRLMTRPRRRRIGGRVLRVFHKSGRRLVEVVAPRWRASRRAGGAAPRTPRGILRAKEGRRSVERAQPGFEGVEDGCGLGLGQDQRR